MIIDTDMLLQKNKEYTKMIQICCCRLLALDSESSKPLLTAALAADPIADWREYGELLLFL